MWLEGEGREGKGREMLCHVGVRGEERRGVGMGMGIGVGA